MKLSIQMLLCLVLVSFSMAQDQESDPDTLGYDPNITAEPSKALYFHVHPGTLFFTLYKLDILDSVIDIPTINGALVYFTAEREWKSKTSIIINPSLWVAKNIFRIGTDVGLRHYVISDSYKGPYIQASGGFYYLGEDYTKPQSIDNVHNAIPIINFMGNVGIAYKRPNSLSFFTDVGLGFRKTFGELVTEDNHSLMRTFVFDLNVGLGLGF